MSPHWGFCDWVMIVSGVNTRGFAGRLFPHVVTIDHVAFADVELAVENDRVCPTRSFAAAGDFEVANRLEGLGGSLH